MGLRIEQLESILWRLYDPDCQAPKRFRVVVEGILNQYSSQSVLFRQKHRKPRDDLFYSPNGKGSGTWAVRRNVADEWLKRHGAARSAGPLSPVHDRHPHHPKVAGQVRDTP